MIFGRRASSMPMYFMIMLLLIIHFSLYLHVAQDLPTDNSLISLLLDPTDLMGSDALSNWIGVIFLLGGAASIYFGAFLKSEFPIYAGIGLAFLGLISAFGRLYQLLYSVNFMMAQSSPVPLILVLSPLIIGYVYAVIEYIRGRA